MGVGVWHFMWGWAKWLKLAPSQAGVAGAKGQLRRKRRWYGVNGVAASVSGLWLAGSLMVMGRAGRTEGWVGREYDELLKHVPVLGRWR